MGRTTVDFGFDCDDKVQASLGSIGLFTMLGVTMGGIDNGEFPVYHVVDAENNARWFAGSLLSPVKD